MGVFSAGESIFFSFAETKLCVSGDIQLLSLKESKILEKGLPTRRVFFIMNSALKNRPQTLMLYHFSRS